jgi:serine/threonine protein kinase
VSAFDLLEKMLEVDREERFTLQEAIAYAEQMYEVQESLAQQASPSHPTRFIPSSNKKGASQHRTANSSPKPPSTNRFYDFRNSTVCDRDDNSMAVSLRSPRVANFTIEEVEPEREEQSSMLESLTVENMRPGITESVVEGGIFSTVNIADSYNYGNHPRFNSTLKEERLFTNPDLLRTIHRELREIEERKRNRHREDSIISSGSRVI